MSADAHSVEIYKQRNEERQKIASFGIDFVLGMVDIKSFPAALSAMDYLAAAIDIIPGSGDVAAKAIEEALPTLRLIALNP